MKDWAIRALKTFVQAFFGVLIPAVCAMLQNGWPESISKAWVILAPTVAAALSAAICAVWNIVLEALEKGNPVSEHPPDSMDNVTSHTVENGNAHEIDFIENGFLSNEDRTD